MVHRRWGAARLVAATVAMWSIAALADVQVTGTIHGTDQSKPNGGGQGQFTCFGMPTCSGSVSVLTQGSQCSNTFSWSTTFNVTGLDLSHPGTLSGTVTLAQQQTHTNNLADGTCTYSLGPGGSWPYTGTWDGTNGSLTITSTNGSGQPDTLVAAFTANVPVTPPVFPMTVTGNVTPTTTSASATIQTRPQDQGTPENVFVFAHAPSNLVSGFKRAGTTPVAAQTSDAVVCVLAQVTPSGQLVAVSASTMQAYLTGVIGSQQQQVTLLNNVSTSSVAGATVFVGYGPDAQSMLSNGVFQTAISVPGGVQCTASLASAPAANSPGPLAGLWWDASESGWGVYFTQRRNIVFAAWYTYDASGNPKWYVASNCTMPDGTTGATGTCSGTLYQVNGPVFFGVPFNPSLDNVTAVGNLQVSFANANNASMTSTVAGQTRSVAITRQPITSGQTPPAVDYTDLWYNASESGWGIAMAHQFGVIFLAWYVYDASGNPVWYVASNCTMAGSSCSGTLYRTTGPAFGPTFDPTRVQAFAVGSAIVSFVDANNAVLSYTVDGVSGTKTITRQAF